MVAVGRGVGEDVVAAVAGADEGAEGLAVVGEENELALADGEGGQADDAEGAWPDGAAEEAEGDGVAGGAFEGAFDAEGDERVDTGALGGIEGFAADGGDGAADDRVGLGDELGEGGGEDGGGAGGGGEGGEEEDGEKEGKRDGENGGRRSGARSPGTADRGRSGARHGGAGVRRRERGVCCGKGGQRGPESGDGGGARPWAAG